MTKQDLQDKLINKELQNIWLGINLQCLIQTYGHSKLTWSEKSTLVLIMAHQSTKNIYHVPQEDLMLELGEMHPKMFARIIKRLVDLKLIEKIKKGSKTYFRALNVPKYVAKNERVVISEKECPPDYTNGNNEPF